MKKIVTTAQNILEIETACFDKGMPIAALMEKAGLKISNCIRKQYSKKKFPKVGVLVGRGHNGGDALVVARELLLKGYSVYVYAPELDFKELTKKHWDYFNFIGGKVARDICELNLCSFYVDGIFGFGLSRSLDNNLKEVIGFLNKAQKPIVSIDLPSGMHSDLGISFGACVQATHTYCLGLYKHGLLQDYTVDNIGQLHFIDLGFTSKILPQKMLHSNDFAFALNKALFIDDFNLQKYKIKKSANKYTRGTCLLICGSTNYPGAAILSSAGAFSSGAGYVKLITDKEVKNLVLISHPETVILSKDELSSVELFSKSIRDKNFCILYGPGIGNQKSLGFILNACEALSEKTNTEPPPIIIDADGLQEINENLESFRKYRGTKILTPHMGEFKNLVPEIYEKLITNTTFQAKRGSLNKFSAAQFAAQKLNCIIILKGPKTVITDGKSNNYINIDSTPSLAKAGTGDTLAGYLSGLIARGIPSIKAACLAVFSHSQAALCIEKRFGESSVSPLKIAEELSNFEIKKNTPI